MFSWLCKLSFKPYRWFQKSGFISKITWKSFGFLSLCLKRDCWSSTLPSLIERTRLDFSHWIAYSLFIFPQPKVETLVNTLPCYKSRFQTFSLGITFWNASIGKRMNMICWECKINLNRHPWRACESIISWMLPVISQPSISCPLRLCKHSQNRNFFKSRNKQICL